MFVVMKVQRWDSVEGSMLGLPAQIAHNPDDPCVGFLPVFDTREAAIAFAGGPEHVVEVREVDATPAPPALQEGWGGPLLASKFHYFVNGEALCRRWAFRGELQAGKVGEPCRTEDCVACYRKLGKRRAAKAQGGQS